MKLLSDSTVTPLGGLQNLEISRRQIRCLLIRTRRRECVRNMCHVKPVRLIFGSTIVLGDLYSWLAVRDLQTRPGS